MNPLVGYASPPMMGQELTQRFPITVGFESGGVLVRNGNVVLKDRITRPKSRLPKRPGPGFSVRLPFEGSADEVAVRNRGAATLPAWSPPPSTNLLGVNIAPQIGCLYQYTFVGVAPTPDRSCWPQTICLDLASTEGQVPSCV